MPRTKKPAGQAADSRNGRRDELVMSGAGQVQRLELRIVLSQHSPQAQSSRDFEVGKVHGDEPGRPAVVFAVGQRAKRFTQTLRHLGQRGQQIGWHVDCLT